MSPFKKNYLITQGSIDLTHRWRLLSQFFNEGFAVPTFSEGFGPSPIEGMRQALVHCFKKFPLATDFAGAQLFTDL